jgi:hypothetical protein
MDALNQTINTAVAKNDYSSLISIFSDVNGPAAWHRVGQGEQRSVAAHFLEVAVTSPNFLPKAFSDEDMVNVMITALGHLPSTVPKACDNQLRQMLFDHKVKQEGDYAGAARILGGMRMEDDTNSVYYMNPAEKCDVFVKIAECFLAVSIV